MRDQIVLATKYASGFRSYKGQDEIQANSVGNNSKSLRVSVHASLRKLRTDYIDLVRFNSPFPGIRVIAIYTKSYTQLYIHWWDFSTSIEEVMQSLNQLIASGKVLYLGVSDTPAWVVSRANQCTPLQSPPPVSNKPI